MQKSTNLNIEGEKETRFCLQKICVSLLLNVLKFSFRFFYTLCHHDFREIMWKTWEINGKF
jgi:hypothetical protein